MLIIIDRKVPAQAKEKLAAVMSRQPEVNALGLLELETTGLVYPAISGHPDIFFCKLPDRLVIPPNLPAEYLSFLRNHKIDFFVGHLAVGNTYPETVHYNAAIDDHCLVHRLDITDPVILENCHFLEKVPVKQGYTRCNLVLLREKRFITSDAGIYRTMRYHGGEGILVSPEGIQLPGFPNGFIGGAMGILKNTVFLLGSLDHYAEGERVRGFLDDSGQDIVELYDGPLADAGGILFL
jgi:hypothetical protein